MTVTDPTAAVETTENVVQIHVSNLEPHPDNRTFRTTGTDWKQFVDSVRENGVLEPCLVRQVSSNGTTTYQIVAGHRRASAAEEAGLPWVPCIVRNVDDKTALVTQLVENLHREDIDPIQEASTMFRLVECEMTQADIAQAVGRSKKHVSERLRLLALPGDIQAKVAAGTFPIADALEWAKVKDEPEIIAAAAEILADEDNYVRSPERALEHARMEAERKVAQAKFAELEEHGIKVHYVTDRWYNAIPKGMTPLTDFDQPNKAVRLPDGGVPEWLCLHVSFTGKPTWCTTDPKATRKMFPKPGLTDEERAQKEKEREVRRKLAEAAEAERERMLAWIHGKAPVSELATQAAFLVREFMHAETAKEVLKLLGIEFDKQDYGTTALAKANVDDRTLVRALYALKVKAMASRTYGLDKDEIKTAKAAWQAIAGPPPRAPRKPKAEVSPDADAAADAKAEAPAEA